jgi:F-type H+-transporting ATPase subunit delta
MAVVLQAASRESLAQAGSRLDAHLDRASAADLERLGEELAAVTRLLMAEKSLRRHLADPSVPAESRGGLVGHVLRDRVGAPAIDVVSGLATARWSRPIDLVNALEVLARRATLGVAEKDRTLDDVEDELFRFGRILDREPELNTLLSDTSAPEERRIALLEQVLGGRTSAVTTALLRQTVRLPRGRHLDVVAEELAELAAARRERYVARVASPVPLTEAQERRLTESLTLLYGRPISVQVELDEGLLGGLVVQVGGEVIDGSVAGKLAAARRSLPS